VFPVGLEPPISTPLRVEGIIFNQSCLHHPFGKLDSSETIKGDILHIVVTFLAARNNIIVTGVLLSSVLLLGMDGGLTVLTLR